MRLETLSENFLFQRIIAPVSGLGSTTQPAGAYIDVSDYEHFAFIVMLGVTDRTTQTLQVVQATAADGTGSKDVGGALINGLSATDDGKLAIVQVDTENLDSAGGFRYVAATPTFSGGTGDVGAILFVAWGKKSLGAVVQGATVDQLVQV
jgi:hypothetical protein